MDMAEFNTILNNLLKKIIKNKKLFLLDDSNIDLMHYNEQKINEFSDSLTSNSYLSYIIQPS